MSTHMDYLSEVFAQHGWIGDDPDADLVTPGWRWIGLYDFSGPDKTDPEPINVIREETDQFAVYDRDSLPRAYKFHRLHFDF